MRSKKKTRMKKKEKEKRRIDCMEYPRLQTGDTGKTMQRALKYGWMDRS